jgi:hypothetical protein
MDAKERKTKNEPKDYFGSWETQTQAEALLLYTRRDITVLRRR